MKRLMLSVLSLCVSICFCGNVNAQTSPSCDQVAQYIYTSAGADKGYALSLPYLDGPPSILKPYETALAEFWMVDPEDKKISLKWISGLSQWANQCYNYMKSTESAERGPTNAMSLFVFYVGQVKGQLERDQKDQAYRLSLSNNGVPQCTSAGFIRDVEDSVRKSPVGRTQGLELLEIENIKDISKFDANTVKRTCSGTGDFNNGEHPITFTARLVNAKTGDFMIGANWYGAGTKVSPGYGGDDSNEDNENMQQDFCAEFGGAYCH